MTSKALIFFHHSLSSVCFTLLDTNKDSLLDRGELTAAMEVLTALREENTPLAEREEQRTMEDDQVQQQLVNLSYACISQPVSSMFENMHCLCIMCVLIVIMYCLVIYTVCVFARFQERHFSLLAEEALSAFAADKVTFHVL